MASLLKVLIEQSLLNRDHALIDKYALFNKLLCVDVLTDMRTLDTNELMLLSAIDECQIDSPHVQKAVSAFFEEEEKIVKRLEQDYANEWL